MTFRDWNSSGGSPFGGFPFGGFPFGGGESSERRAPQTLKLNFSRKTIVLLALLFFLTAGLPALANFLADYYWFSAEGIASVFWKRLMPQWILAAAVAILTFAVLYPNVRLALRLARDVRIPAAEGLSALLRHPLAVWAPLAVSVVVAVSDGAGAMDKWQMIFQFLYGGEFGSKDAIFGNDIGFYMFSLPFWNFLQSWLVGVLTASLFLCGGLYGLTVMAASHETGRISIPVKIRAHALLLAAGIVFCWGLSYVLDRYLILYNPNGVTFGPGYTDIHANLLALTVLAALAFAASLLLVFAIYSNRSWRFIGAIAAVFIVSNVLLRGVYPSLVQKYIVVPNEFEKEKQYISNNIAATLEAYGMNGMEIREVTPDAGLTEADVQADMETVENVRLWDYRALLRSYKQLQEIRSYYDFSAIDIDRYRINGKVRQTMLAPRELDLRGMQNRTWVNQRLEFTHGYGIVMNGAREIRQNGQPNLWIKDLPPVSTVDIPIERPQIYFGEAPSSYVFVKTETKEFDYPLGESNARSTYEGTGGVPMGSLWRRLVFALAFGDSKILFSDVFTPESRVIYERNIRDRLNRAAPFLAYDTDPYIAVIDGRIVWIVDAYTMSNLYPYSEPIGGRLRNGRMPRGVNYIRNSVKCVVDAYDGHMKFYVIDESDPLIACWRKIFPALFSPASEISPSLREHLRYPRNLFSIQAEVYRTYHMTDPNTFYNKEDVWNTLAGGENDGTLSSYYVMMKLIGEDNPEFLIMTPYTPVSRDNMIAWMAGRSDGENYGKLVLYRFPKRTLIYGPNQISALINQTPEISAQLSLWSQRGSDVIHGHLLVIPVNNSLLYVRPLYLKASQSDLPELKRVILSSGGRVVWDETFEGALEKLLKPEDSDGTEEPTAPAERPVTAPAAGDSELAVRAREAKNAWNRSQEALKNADWKEYGDAMSDLEKSLNAMFPDGVQ